MTMQETYTDNDGDRLELSGTDDGHVIVGTERANGKRFSNMLLTRTAAAHLHRALGEHLEATEATEPAVGAVDDHATPEGPLGEWTETVLEEAQRHVYGSRQGDYGHPREDMTRQAIMWTGLLHHKLADGAHLEPEDVARCMVAVKLARDVNSPKRDNRVDGAGYFLCLDRLETGR